MSQHRTRLKVAIGALFALLMTAGAGFASTSGGQASNSTVLKIAFTGPADGQIGKTIQRFANDVAKSSAAKDVRVQIYDNGSLGTSADGTWDAMRLGTINGWAGPQTSAERTVPQFGVFDLPYIFNGAKGEAKVLANKAIISTYSSALAGTGVHVLSFWNGGERDLYNNVRPVREPSDLKGMKVRIISSAVYTYFWSAMGAQPTPIPQADVYLALSQGTLDGAETVWASALASKHDEVAKYWERTQHAWGLSLLAVNAGWFKSLSKSDQAALTAAAKDAGVFAQKEGVANVAANVATLKAEGKTVITPDMKAFRAIGRGVMKHFAGTYGKATINQILKAQGLKQLP